MKGRTLTLKLKRKKSGAPEPIKFLASGLINPYGNSKACMRGTVSCSCIDTGEARE